MQKLLADNCQKQASQFVAYMLDTNMQVLSNFVRRDKMGDALSYMKERDPDVLNSAGSYSAKFPNPWKEEACN